MTKISYSGYRFPPEIIQQAIWLYLRFTLSFRDVEDLLAERGIMVSYETVRRWVNHFGPMIAADLRKRRPKSHMTWHLDEVYLKIDGRMVYLWRAVDAEGEALDVLVQTRGGNRWGDYGTGLNFVARRGEARGAWTEARVSGLGRGLGAGIWGRLASEMPRKLYLRYYKHKQNQ
jgi:DDE domain